MSYECGKIALLETRSGKAASICQPCVHGKTPRANMERHPCLMQRMQKRIRNFSGHIVASWPRNSFPFVPLDFWVSTAAYATSGSHTAPIPVDLVVFQNSAAATLFPLQIQHLHLLQCWTLMFMGNLGKKTKWDPGYPSGVGTWAGEDLENWWEKERSMQQLLDILMPQSQWWRQKCEGPFSGVDPWPGLWGNPPPQLRDWMLL